MAYFAELDTDMTSAGLRHRGRGSGCSAAARSPASRRSRSGIGALERGIAQRKRIIVAPWWVRPALSTRMAIQPVVELVVRRDLRAALEIARGEQVELTTPQPERR